MGQNKRNIRKRYGDLIGVFAAGAIVVGSIGVMKSVIERKSPGADPQRGASAGEVALQAAIPDAGPEVPVVDHTFADGSNWNPEVFTPVEKLPDYDHAARAAKLIEQGDAVAAVGELAAAVEKEPSNADLHWKLARLDGGALGDASLEELTNLSVLETDAPKELARRRLERKDFPGAVDAAKTAARRAPGDWETHHLAGRAELGRQRIGAAIRHFATASRQPGAPSHPFNNLGYAYLLAGRPERAVTALESAVDREPLEAYMMNSLGLAYLKTDRVDEAEFAFLGALEIDEDYVKARVNLGKIEVARRVIEEEFAAIAAAEALPPVEAAPSPAEGTPVQPPEGLVSDAETEGAEPEMMHGG